VQQWDDQLIAGGTIKGWCDGIGSSTPSRIFHEDATIELAELQGQKATLVLFTQARVVVVV